MSYRLWTAALCAAILAHAAGAAKADYTLHILHMNDWHSRIEPVNAFRSTCTHEEDADGKCFGGAARLAAAVAQKRKELAGENVIFLNAGDNFQGSLFYSIYKGDVEAEFLNHMGVDAMAAGNHELGQGDAGLARFIEQVKFPVLAGNVRPSRSSVLSGKIRASTILEAGGKKIGIVGVLPNDTDVISEPGSEIEITDDVAALTAAVKDLHAQGVDKIIALTHVGYPRDMEMIGKIPGIDVIVGGHSHTLLHNTDPAAAGPYPDWTDNPDGYRVPVVHAGAWSSWLGVLKVTFDDNGVVTGATGEPIRLDSAIAPDPAIQARIKELDGPIHEALSQPVAQASAPIEGNREACRARECELGNLVTDAILERMKDRGVEIVIVNGGALRLSIDGGEITMGEILEALPFQNTVSTFDLKGSDIVEALEAGLSEHSEGGGRFPQVAGLRYVFDPMKPAGKNRVIRVEVRQGERWTLLDPDRIYRVATNDFLRSGADGYVMFRDRAMNARDDGPLFVDVVADHLRAAGLYRPHLDGRILQGSAAPVEALPAANASGVDAPGESRRAALPESHEIRPGDTLWDIAVSRYGDGSLWRGIAKANPGIRARHLPVGKELVLPELQ